MKNLRLFWNWVVRLFQPLLNEIKEQHSDITVRRAKRGKVYRAMKNSHCRFASTKGFALS